MARKKIVFLKTESAMLQTEILKEKMRERRKNARDTCDVRLGTRQHSHSGCKTTPTTTTFSGRLSESVRVITHGVNEAHKTGLPTTLAERFQGVPIPTLSGDTFASPQGMTSTPTTSHGKRLVGSTIPISFEFVNVHIKNFSDTALETACHGDFQRDFNNVIYAFQL